MKLFVKRGDNFGFLFNVFAVDLYTWVLNAHRERKEKREGRKTAHQGGSKYVNPMDIVQKAFFYSIYRFRQLEWTGVEEVAVEKFTAHFEVQIRRWDVFPAKLGHHLSSHY